MAEWGWISGNHWVICDDCQMKKRRSEILLVKNRVVCRTCYDEPHPLDYARPFKRDERARPVRARTIKYKDGPACTIEERTGVAGVGAAGCMTVGFNPSL